MKWRNGEAEKRRSVGNRLSDSPILRFPASYCPAILTYIFIGLFLLLAQPAWADTGAGQWLKVRWVDDGDTIVLVDGRRVRYIGMNAPEIDHPKYDRKAEPFGYEALRFNKSLVFRKQIRLELDQEKFDRYDRLLAYVFLSNGIFVNLELIRSGCAFYLARKPNDRYDKQLLKAQREAMTAEKGMWRHWQEAGEGYIGNRRSRRFHLKQCPFGQKISRKNRVYFSKRWDAFWAGYAPAKRCRP
jgi:micrococcal nuclease